MKMSSKTSNRLAVRWLERTLIRVRSVVQVHSGLPNLHGKFEEVLTTRYGAIAQLGERLLCMKKLTVRSRIAPPSRSD